MRERYSPGRERWKELAVYGAGLLFILGVSRGCSAVAESNYSANDAENYLEDSGYANIELKDTDYWLIQLAGCSEEDSVKYEFEAVGATGREVDVDVCVGVFKGASIRD